jgi:hypothetical protein
MRTGRYFRIPEGPADLEQLWEQAWRLDQASLPSWLPPEHAATYRHLGACRHTSPGEDETYRGELEQLETAGLIVEADPGRHGQHRVYIAEPPQEAVWSIALYGGRSPFDLAPLPAVANPVLTRAQVTDVPAVFVADPFMLRSGTTWYMFFEVMNWRANKGEIGLATSNDGTTWTYQQIVLSEPFHLSYPYVFEWLGDYYMIPESYQAGSIRLYKAAKFPTIWSLAHILLEGDYLVDASVLRHQGKWWLFTETNPEGKHDTLRLFHADDLPGPWQEHPLSPVVNGNERLARPAGRVLTYDDKVIRFAQDCSPAYGTQVRAFEVAELTPSTYRESEARLSPVLSPGSGGWNAGGMHHIDAHAVSDGNWLACVDGWFSEPAGGPGQ